MKRSIVINIFPGPGAGKSTMAAGIYYKLKMRGVNAELVREYAKLKVWEGSTGVLKDQFYVSGKQNHDVRLLNGNVDIIITDSPIVLGTIYDERKDPILKDYLINEFKQYNNINYYIRRVPGDYLQDGRMQTEAQSNVCDQEIKELLDSNDIPYRYITKSEESISLIIDDLITEFSLINNLEVVKKLKTSI